MGRGICICMHFTKAGQKKPGFGFANQLIYGRKSDDNQIP